MCGDIWRTWNRSVLCEIMCAHVAILGELPESCLDPQEQGQTLLTSAQTTQVQTDSGWTF